MNLLTDQRIRRVEHGKGEPEGIYEKCLCGVPFIGRTALYEHIARAESTYKRLAEANFVPVWIEDGFGHKPWFCRARCTKCGKVYRADSYSKIWSHDWDHKRKEERSKQIIKIILKQKADCSAWIVGCGDKKEEIENFEVALLTARNYHLMNEGATIIFAVVCVGGLHKQELAYATGKISHARYNAWKDRFHNQGGK